MLIANRYEPGPSGVSGGMSHTLICNDTHLNRKVLIKSLQAGEEGRRLVDEQKALLSLRSKHVVQLLDIVEHNGAPGLVLEFIEGADLEIGRLPIDAAYLHTLWQIADGLVDVHSQGVVHRDLKPNNIRRDVHGVIKIIDFGLSRQLGVDAKTGSAIGFLPFMAPELFKAGVVDFDEKVDVYAFGVSALSMSTSGIPAFLEKGPYKPAPTTAVTDHLGSIDAGVAAILQRCLDHDPAARPTMLDVRRTLETTLLFNRHRARISLRGNIYEIDSVKTNSNPAVTVAGKTVSSIGIHYNGIWFSVTSVTGTVRLNNMTAKVGSSMPSACVIEFEYAPASYIYATFDVSNPEVML